MESSVGYSQGTGTSIATHKFGEGVDAVHHQRFAVGTGKADMHLLIRAVTAVTETSAESCEGAGRVVLAPMCTSNGSIIQVNFFDGNHIDIGSSALITLERSGYTAFGAIPIGWYGDNEFGQGAHIRIASNSHVYRQIEAFGNSGLTEPVWPTDGASVADGPLAWTDLGTYTGMQTCPLIVFSNSMGASYYVVKVTTIAGTLTVFGDAV